MAGGCINNCTKYLIGVMNFLLMLGSFILFCIGIWMLADESAFTRITSISSVAINEGQKEALALFADHVDMTMFGYSLIIVGILVFIVSLVGFCGTLCGLRRLLIAYIVLILLLTLIQITGSALITAYKSETDNRVKDVLRYTIREEYGVLEDKTSAVTLIWDVIMTKQRCCGVESYKDFQNSHLITRIVPEACCKLHIDERTLSTTIDPTCPYQPTPSNSYMNQGCYEKIQQWWEKNYLMLTGVMVIIVGAQIILLVYLTSLCISTRPDRRPRYLGRFI